MSVKSLAVLVAVLGIFVPTAVGEQHYPPVPPFPRRLPKLPHNLLALVRHGDSVDPSACSGYDFDLVRLMAAASSSDISVGFIDTSVQSDVLTSLFHTRTPATSLLTPDLQWGGDGCASWLLHRDSNGGVSGYVPPSSGFSVESVVAFVQGRGGALASSHVQSVTAKQLTAVASDARQGHGCVVLHLYDPMCEPCVRAVPMLETVASAFRHDESVQFVRVDVNQNPELRPSDPQTLPVTRLIHGRAKTGDPYTGTSKPEALVKAVNRVAGTEWQLGGTLAPTAGRVPVFDVLCRGFATLAPEVQASVVEDATEARKGLRKDLRQPASVYVSLMKNAMASPDAIAYLDNELRTAEAEIESQPAGSGMAILFTKRRNVLLVLTGTSGRRHHTHTEL